MSQPTIPPVDPEMTREDALNMILASIAMEEMGLSHIINAEGEKIQYILGTLPGRKGPECSTEEVIAVNGSVKQLLDSVMQNQIFLKAKLEQVLNSADGAKPGPPGPRGPCGPVGPVGPQGHCGISAFMNPEKLCWESCYPMTWEESCCSDRCTASLSPDRSGILLKKQTCYLVSFSLNVHFSTRESHELTLELQTHFCGHKKHSFCYHAPVVCPETPITASAAGIVIPASHTPARLVLTLISPEVVRAEQVYLSVTEIC